MVLQDGLRVRRDWNKSTTNRWKEILRGDAISHEELEDLSFDWNAHFRDKNTRPKDASSVNRPDRGLWRANKRNPNNTRKAVLYPDVLAYTLHTDTVPVLTSSHPPAVQTRLPLPSVANQLDVRMIAMRRAQLKKFQEMERLHMSEWYKLSSNKEKDERGSRASISVEGLRRPTSETATTDLRHMLHIAHNHFRDLHRVQEPSEECKCLQNELLDEIVEEYG